MRQKNVFIFAAVAAVLLIAILYWRNTHPARKRIVVKKHAARVVKKAPPAVGLAAIPKNFASPRVAIVIDDFGYNKNNLDTLFGIDQIVTLSILPNLKYSTEIAVLARAHECEVILHLPLEAHNTSVKEEPDTIRSGMGENEIVAKLKKEIASVPGIDGVSNHMGSKATEDKELMALIFKYLKSKKLYFFDSLTSQNSVCRQAASEAGIQYARRDVFLDNEDNQAAIEKQLLILRRLAFRKGKAIAICHDRKNTMAVLARMMPAMAREGVKFVRLSELVK